LRLFFYNQCFCSENASFGSHFPVLVRLSLITVRCPMVPHFNTTMPKTSKKSRNLRRRIASTKLVPRSTTVRGRGPFWADLKQVGRKLAAGGMRGVGRAIGNTFGAGNIGHAAGAALSKFVGFGPYGMPWTVSRNSVMHSDSGVPEMASTRDRGFNVKHTEFLGFVTSSTSFNMSVYPLQVGNSTTFPWLCKIAANFSEYRINGAVVAFRSSLTSAVATFSSLGNLSIAADMNAAASPPPSFVAMEQLKYCMAVKPSENGNAPIECDPALHRTQYFVRAGAVPPGASVNDFDHCNVFVATTGMPSNNVQLGRLYITYDIDLMEPKLLDVSHAQELAVCNAVTNSAAALFQTPNMVYDSIGLDFLGNSVFIPANVSGNFILEYFGVFSASMNAAIPTLTLANCQLSTSNIFPSPTGPSYVTVAPGVGVSTSAVSLKWLMYKPTVSQVATVTFPVTGVVPTTGTHNLTISLHYIPLSPPQFTALRHAAPLDLESIPPPDGEDDDEKYPDELIPSVPNPPTTIAAAGVAKVRRS